MTMYQHPAPLWQNLGTLTSWNRLGPSGPVTGLLYLYLLLDITWFTDKYWFHLSSTKFWEPMCFIKNHWPQRKLEFSAPYLVEEPYIPFSLNCRWCGSPTRLLAARWCKMPHIKRIHVNDFQFLGGLHDFHCKHLTLTPHFVMWSYLKDHVFHNKTCKLTHKQKQWKQNQAICKYNTQTYYQQHAMPHPDAHGADWRSLPANNLTSICSRWNKVHHITIITFCSAICDL